MARKPKAAEWLRATLTAPDAHHVAFLQEVPAAVHAGPPPGYEAVAGQPAPRACEGLTSMVYVREGLGDLDTPHAPAGVDGDRPFASLGTYVATARLALPDVTALLISAHTSPSPVSDEKMRPAFRTRSCETRPWWSDAFTAELRAFVAGGADPLILEPVTSTRPWPTTRPPASLTGAAASSWRQSPTADWSM